MSPNVAARQAAPSTNVCCYQRHRPEHTLFYRIIEIVAQEAGFSLHAGFVAKSHERTKRERLCRYITRPQVSEARLSLTLQGHIRYQLKTPYRLDLQIGLGVLDRWTCAERRVLADACGCRGR